MGIHEKRVSSDRLELGACAPSEEKERRKKHRQEYKGLPHKDAWGGGIHVWEGKDVLGKRNGP